MQQWEYLFVTAYYRPLAWGEASIDPLRVKYVNDQEVPDWDKGVPAHAYCNTLGEQGWELANTAIMSGTVGDHVVTQFFFKRPKP